MVERVQEALAQFGIDDEVVAAGMFFPRGHSGALFAGGLVGGGIGGELGRVAGDVGLVAGSLGAQKAADAASGLPERMMVYGFDTQREHGREPTDLIFRLPRSAAGGEGAPAGQRPGGGADRRGDRLPGGAGGRAHRRLPRGGRDRRAAFLSYASIVTLMASPLVTVWMASIVRSKGRRWVIRSATGTSPEAISARACWLWAGLEPLAPTIPTSR
jgi:hypothetical protein